MKRKSYDDRSELLADVAEMYYEEVKTQAQISGNFGITRSAISRILTEARQKGIVEITIHRKINFNYALEQALKQRFNLRSTHIVSLQHTSRREALMNRIGTAAARVIDGYLLPNQTVGLAWGYTIAATIEQFSAHEIENIKVVQLVGVLGSSMHTYSGQALVEQLTRKVHGEGTYLYTPFIVKDAETAQALLLDPSTRKAITIGQQCQTALLGVGSTIPEHCSLYQGGYITLEDLTTLQNAGAVGDVGGHYFDIDGNTANSDFHQRMVGISKSDMKNIPNRIGIAGGKLKTEAIYGAIVGGYLNILISDSQLAESLLQLADKKGYKK
ncbi:MAG: sugar-binding transcriptional regulator [Anaerolineaceae bacterium]|nr:sugar-binding transcriptional regulator [Anaerolineaceae bacterium]